MEKGTQTLILEKDYFRLPDTFRGSVSQALRLLANYLEDNKETKFNIKIKETKNGTSH